MAAVAALHDRVESTPACEGLSWSAAARRRASGTPTGSYHRPCRGAGAGRGGRGGDKLLRPTLRVLDFQTLPCPMILRISSLLPVAIPANLTVGRGQDGGERMYVI